MYLKKSGEGYDYETAELAFVYIKQLKTWRNQCVSLHPNIECSLDEQCDIDNPIIRVVEKDEFDLFQSKNLNIKTIVGENGSGKTTLLDVLRKGTEGTVVVLRNSSGKYISSGKIKLKICSKEQNEAFIELAENVLGPIEHVSDLSMLTPLAERNSKNRIVEEPFYFDIRFFEIYQKNVQLYQFDKDYELMPFFHVRPLPSFTSKIKLYIEDLPGVEYVNDSLFEDDFLQDPTYFILLTQFLEDKDLWKNFKSSESIVLVQNVLRYFVEMFNLKKSTWDDDNKKLFEDLSRIINDFFVCDGKRRSFNTSDFSEIKERFEKSLLSLKKLVKDVFGFNPDFSLFYYQGFALINGKERCLLDLSDGEYTSLKQRYLWYAALTQVSESSGYYLTMDEPDENLHPEWKRCFWKNFVDSFDFVKEYVAKQFLELSKDAEEYDRNRYRLKKKIVETRRFGLIVSTHSPFLLSDLFSHNVVYLEKEMKDDSWISVVKKSPKTFAGNIGEMFYESFFMKSTVGAYAEGYIKRILNIRNGKNPDNPNIILSESEKICLNQEADSIVENISDPVIRCLLE